MTKPTVPYKELPEGARKCLDAIIESCLDYDKIPAGVTREQAHDSVVYYLETGDIQLLDHCDGTFSLHRTDQLIDHGNGTFSLKY